MGSSGGGSGAGAGSVHLENIDADTEPYYDTVPIEENNGDTLNYVNSNKNVSSSLPKIFDRQISADVGGQVGERSSNYINIDYFLSYVFLIIIFFIAISSTIYSRGTTFNFTTFILVFQTKSKITR